MIDRNGQSAYYITLSFIKSPTNEYNRFENKITQSVLRPKKYTEN